MTDDDLPLSPQLRHQAGAFLSLKRASQWIRKKYREKNLLSIAERYSSSNSSPSRIMFPNSMNDLPAQRRESATQRPRDIRPLLTHEPLVRDRERRPQAPPQRKRKRAAPTTPALSFDPKRNHIPSGKQDPPVSPPTLPKPSVSESATSPYDEQTTPFADRETHTPFYDGHDAHRWPRITSEHSSTEYPTSYYPDAPYTDVNDMNSVPAESYDSPASYASSSSPAPSDQSSRTGVPGIEYPCQAQPSMPMGPHDNPVYAQPVIHQVSYGYAMNPFPDRPAQCLDPAYGKPGLHGGPAYPGNNGYYPPSRRQ